MLQKSEISQLRVELLSYICPLASVRRFPDVSLQPKKLAPAPHASLTLFSSLEVCEFLIKILSLSWLSKEWGQSLITFLKLQKDWTLWGRGAGALGKWTGMCHIRVIEQKTEYSTADGRTPCRRPGPCRWPGPCWWQDHALNTSLEGGVGLAHPQLRTMGCRNQWM